ncbi:MAG: transcription termination/antitermination protein NusA, partial [Verrucomicrobiota bacterium]
RELNNEKVDIIRWSEDPKEFVREALKPAELRTIVTDEENRVIYVTVDDEDLSKAIGRKGQNARLSSRLMGWDVQVRRDESKEEQFKEKIGGAAHTLGEQLGISDELANKLTLAGGFSPEMVVEMPADYIAQALEITEEAAEAILVRAQAIINGIAPTGSDE